MSARIIDGKAMAQGFRDSYAAAVARLKEQGIVPGLAVVIVGDDPASKVYVRNKALACEKAGMHSEVHALPADTTQQRLLDFVRRLNADPALHGILVQLPLPKQLDSRAVIEAIAPEKDVDGFHYRNAGALLVGGPAFYPCTPWGVMKMLEHEGVEMKVQAQRRIRSLCADDGPAASARVPLITGAATVEGLHGDERVRLRAG